MNAHYRDREPALMKKKQNGGKRLNEFLSPKLRVVTQKLLHYET